MLRAILGTFLGISLLFSGHIFAVGDLHVITCFFTGQWAPGGFTALEKALNESKVLNKKYDKIGTIDICLGSGEKEEELRNGWKVIETIKKSFENNLAIQNLVKTYKTEKPEVRMVLSSVAAVLVRCAIQKYGSELPFVPKQLVSICGPQTGIYCIPPDGSYTNSVEQACSEVQKFTTDSIMKTLPMGSFLSGPASIFGWVTGPSYMASVAYLTLYRESVQENWISLWRDPYHLKEYQSCRAKSFPPFLPFFNNELGSQDAKIYKSALESCKKNIGIIDRFDFIASEDDKIILPQTALCEEEEVVDGVKKYRDKTVFLSRIGVNPKKAQFHMVKGAKHQCHTNQDVIKKTVECIENQEYKSVAL